MEMADSTIAPLITSALEIALGKTSNRPLMIAGRTNKLMISGVITMFITRLFPAAMLEIIWSPGYDPYHG
jgi:hypothetical protein